ncbi:MAG: hypothetical protein K2O22_01295 [Anaeroplasmataceae bacterium]|nr:hypothetical protein [Anaeroplasmataceae bacterium]
MKDKKSTLKEHSFICIMSVVLFVALIILTFHFFTSHEASIEYIIGFIICYLWVLSILPAFYYYIRAEADSLYQRQPRFIFHNRFLVTPGLLIILAPLFVPNYIWLFCLDIKNLKRNKLWEEQK